MQKHISLREEDRKPPLCGEPEPMFMNDKQSKLVRGGPCTIHRSTELKSSSAHLQHQQINANGQALRTCAHVLYSWMTSSRSWTKTALCNAKIYRKEANQRPLTTSVDNCPCTSIAGVYIYFLLQQKPIQ